MKIPKTIRDHDRALDLAYWESLSKDAARPVIWDAANRQTSVKALYRRGALEHGYGDVYREGVVAHMIAVLIPDVQDMAVLVNGTRMGFLTREDATEARVRLGIGGWRNRKRYGTVPARIWAVKDTHGWMSRVTVNFGALTTVDR